MRQTTLDRYLDLWLRFRNYQHIRCKMRRRRLKSTQLVWFVWTAGARNFNTSLDLKYRQHAINREAVADMFDE